MTNDPRSGQLITVCKRGGMKKRRGTPDRPEFLVVRHQAGPERAGLSECYCIIIMTNDPRSGQLITVGKRGGMKKKWGGCGW